MELSAGILFRPTTCIHCSQPTTGAGAACRCAAGLHDRRGRRMDYGEVLFGLGQRLTA